MKNLIVGLILLFSINSYGQIILKKYTTTDELISTDTIPGQVQWDYQGSNICFSQFKENSLYSTNIECSTILNTYRDKITYSHTVDYNGVVFTMTFWRDLPNSVPMVIYTYEDDSYILMYGGINY